MRAVSSWASMPRCQRLGTGVGMAVIGAAGPRAWTAKGLAASGARAAGVVIQLPVIGVAESLAVGLPLLVPQIEPGDLLPVGGLLLLPPQRGAGGMAEL